MTREEAIERLAESYYDIGALGARWENESDDARLPFREDARRIFDSLGLTVAPDPNIYTTNPLVDRIASLRAEVARLRQPPPSPSREEAVERLAVMLHTMIREAVSVALKTHYPTAVVEQLAGAIHGPESLHALAGETLRTLGLVAVPGKLRERLTIERAACAGRVAYEADEGDMSTSYGEACGALADAVLSQLGAKP